MKKDSIALIGFMGTGKTTIGKALADYLGPNHKFIETDQIIVEMADKSIPKIFSEDGEQKFRYYEKEACKIVSKLRKTVISCGGGVVLNQSNIKNLKKNCHIVLLKASLEEIYRRVMTDGKESRPIIDKEDPKKEIKKILKLRQNYYQAAAEITINTTGKETDEIIKEIVKEIS